MILGVVPWPAKYTEPDGQSIGDGPATDGRSSSTAILCTDMGGNPPNDRISTEQMWSNFRQQQADSRRRIEENAERIRREFERTANL